MALETKLFQKMTQQLVMTPQLRQAIKILQVSRTDLETLIDDELAENPVLDAGLEGGEEREIAATAEAPKVDGVVGETDPAPAVEKHESETAMDLADIDWG